MPFFDIFASPRWSPLRMRTKLMPFFIFSRAFKQSKIKALRPKMTKIASRGSCLNGKGTFDEARCPFSTFLRFRGDHHCACAQKWCHFSYFPRAFKHLVIIGCTNNVPAPSLYSNSFKADSTNGWLLKVFFRANMPIFSQTIKLFFGQR